MGWSIAAANARLHSRQRKTSREQTSAWTKWRRFLSAIEVSHDDLLESFPPSQRTFLLSCFALATRVAFLSASTKRTLVAATVRSAVDHVAASFRDYDREDPRLDRDGRISRILSQQFEGYKRKDPPEKQQKAAPTSLILEVTRNKSSERAMAIGRLVVLAHFFALRSYEYTSVPSQEDRRTKMLAVGGIRFNWSGKYISHSDKNLYSADFVSLTFVDQKNGERMESVTQFRTGHPTLCPVRTTAAIISAIHMHKDTTRETTINSFVTEGNRLAKITSAEVRRSLRAAAMVLGEEALGFKPNEIGTHSIRSGAAMAMHLAEVPVYTIMIIGRWSSDAFLRYIRKQVAQFSQNIASRMLTTQHFAHVPDPHVVNSLDPRTWNNPHNAQTRANIGQEQSARRATLSAMATWW